MDTVRVGVVSASGTGRKRTLPALLSSDTCKVTAVHSRDKAKVQGLGRDFGIKHTYSDLGKMIADGQFDIAVVCSPPFLHREQLDMLLHAGIPTLCEKPLVLSVDDALALQALSEQTSTLVMVAHQLRHQNTYAEIKRALAEEQIGEVDSATFSWSYVLNPSAPNAAWKLDPFLNGPTCLSDIGVHCLDLAIGLFGPGKVWGAHSKRREAEGVIEACDMLAVHSGIRVSYELSRLQPPVANNLLITGSRGEILAPDFFTERSAPVVKVTVDGKERTIAQDAGTPYRWVVEDFAALALESGHDSPGTTLAEAIMACQMIEAAEAALGVAQSSAEEREDSLEQEASMADDCER